MPEIADALTAGADRAERDRLRVQLTGERFQPAPQQYSYRGLDWNVLDSREHRSPKVAGRHAVAIDLEVSRAGVLVFRDRILVWDGLRVLTPAPGGRMEGGAGGPCGLPGGQPPSPCPRSSKRRCWRRNATCCIPSASSRGASGRRTSRSASARSRPSSATRRTAGSTRTGPAA